MTDPTPVKRIADAIEAHLGKWQNSGSHKRSHVIRLRDLAEKMTLPRWSLRLIRAEITEPMCCAILVNNLTGKSETRIFHGPCALSLAHNWAFEKLPLRDCIGKLDLEQL